MKIIKAILLLIIVAFLLFYFNLPVINYGFIALPIILLVVTVFGIVLSTGVQISKDAKQVKILKKPSKLFFIISGLLLFYITVFPLLTSLPMFRSESYKNLIGKVADGTKISNHIAPISIDEIRVVDEDLAYLLGEKILGSQPALGSQVELGHFCIQKVGKDLYWVAPLLHSGFFKWMNNQEGTAGYVMVSATNERDVKLVQNIAGKEIKIKYQHEAFFGSQIERHLYFNGYATVGLTDYTFEIDDEGKPFWVVTKYDKKIGFGGNDASGIVVVDAQTGAMTDYTIGDAPKWVDRVQPIDFIEEQLNDWGEYVHGYWNFSNANKLQITEGLTLVYGKDNKSYWYTGLTSVGKEESAVGFVLVDTRTKETTFYKQSGATEIAAQGSAEGKVQEKGYKSSLPIPYNINNIPTYVMTLKDDGGLVKMYAMVAISDYTIVGVGNSMRETLTSFKSAYNMTGNKLNAASLTNKKQLKSVVTRITNDVKNGNSFYYFTTKDYPNIFVGSSQISNQLPVTIVGDSIKVSFDVDNEEVIDVSTFENTTLKKK
ncbi:hypothetical protein [Flavobacterium sp.]|uniref:hypothetical protein n=1 Tax=Flavobacterium sp. TaxID=239 RepID=UPI0037508E9C